VIDRHGLLRTAALVYSVLIALALAGAWLAAVDLAPLIRFDWRGALVGLLAVLPMSVVFFIAPDLKDKVVELLGPALAQCRLWELVLLAAMAGVSEELLFRGTLEGWLRPYGAWSAVIAVNLLFGAMHPMTALYFVIAALLGVYLSLLATVTPERNLTAPIVAHAVYDLAGFLLVARDFRSHSQSLHLDPQPASGESANVEVNEQAGDESPIP
jgi:uncharacterized protein